MESGANHIHDTKQNDTVQIIACTLLL